MKLCKLRKRVSWQASILIPERERANKVRENRKRQRVLGNRGKTCRRLLARNIVRKYIKI